MNHEKHVCPICLTAALSHHCAICGAIDLERLGVFNHDGLPMARAKGISSRAVTLAFVLNSPRRVRAEERRITARLVKGTL